jgi:hypothetical protein
MKDLPPDLLSALPAVASSPAAFTAYCLLILTWLVIALNVRRHQPTLFMVPPGMGTIGSFPAGAGAEMSEPLFAEKN